LTVALISYIGQSEDGLGGPYANVLARETKPLHSSSSHREEANRWRFSVEVQFTPPTARVQVSLSDK